MEGEDAQILIVDDELMNLEVHKTMIQNLKSLKCDTALSGAIALNLIKERLTKVLMNQANMYNFILMDYSMPRMNGPHTVRKIRELLSQDTNEDVQ